MVVRAAHRGLHPALPLPPPRPTVTEAPAGLELGAAAEVTTPDAARIVSSPAAGADGLDAGHRHRTGVRCAVCDNGEKQDGAAGVRVPAVNALGPVGKYALFLVGDEGVPSVARWLTFP